MKEHLSGPLVRMAAGLPATGFPKDATGEEVVRLAKRHGLAPILYSRWKDNDKPGFLTPVLLEELKSHYTETTIRNSWLISDLDQILELTQKANLEVLVLKGMALVILVYGDPGTRPMDDLDLLTDSSDFERVRDLLVDLGFEEQRYFESRVSEEMNREQAGGWVTLRRDRSMIDLHSSIGLGVPGKDLSASLVFSHSIQRPFEGKKMVIPSPEFLLMHLLVHLDKHLHNGVTRYSNLVDILMLVQDKGKELDWNGFNKLAEAAGTLPLCHAWLELIKEEFHLDLPALKADKRILNKSFSVYRKWMVKGEREVKPVVPPWKREPYKNTVETGKKIWYFLGVLFPSATYMIRTYKIKSRLQLILYYPYRLITHTFKYFWGRLRKH